MKYAYIRLHENPRISDFMKIRIYQISWKSF